MGGGGRGLKNLSINGWVKRNCGVDLKMEGGGGNPFQHNFGDTNDT